MKFDTCTKRGPGRRHTEPEKRRRDKHGISKFARVYAQRYKSFPIKGQPHRRG
jgi:hypothetical protein